MGAVGMRRFGGCEKAAVSLNIVEREVSLLSTVTPLHWLLTDRSGASVVVEPTADGIQIHDNPVGVLTNSPDFPWHLTNLRNFIGLQPGQFAAKNGRPDAVGFWSRFRAVRIARRFYAAIPLCQGCIFERAHEACVR